MKPKGLAFTRIPLGSTIGGGPDRQTTLTEARSRTARSFGRRDGDRARPSTQAPPESLRPAIPAFRERCWKSTAEV